MGFDHTLARTGPRLPATGDPELARVVHDLRAPLTVIRGLCEVLARGEAPPGVRRALSTIDGEVARLAEGLEALVDGPPRRCGPVDLAALTADGVSRFRWAAAERRARIVLRGAGPVWVRADPDRLARALDNLLGNAVRHCRGAGCVRVSVSVRDRWARVRVADDGRGVPARDREAIFHAGERGSSPRGPGRGLGLAIAREIAHECGGTLTLEGTTTGAAFLLAVPALVAGEGRG
jgi:two-component system, OmpR family, sensor kinase